jgi:hypothetical protein
MPMDVSLRLLGDVVLLAILDAARESCVLHKQPVVIRAVGISIE